MGTSGRSWSQSPQSCEWLETGHLKVYQEDQKHSKYAGVTAVAKKESKKAGERSRGIRQPRPGAGHTSGIQDDRWEIQNRAP